MFLSKTLDFILGTTEMDFIALRRNSRVILLGALCTLLLSFNCQAAAQISIVPQITTVAGNGTGGYSGDGGPATSATFVLPVSVATDSAGNLYIADTNNFRIRKVSTSGTITTVAGNGTGGYRGDGGLATNAELSDPEGIACDSAGNIYIADLGNNRIRKVDVSTGIITTIAGNGTGGYSGDGGLATNAGLGGPSAVAFDSAGDLYIAADGGDRIRKIDASTGIITTVVGNGTYGFSGDGGPATSAELEDPEGMAFDGAGNLYIVDGNSNRIRKIDASTGIITTVVGNGSYGYSGDGGPATAAATVPASVAVDRAGNIFIANVSYNVIRMVNPSGIITTVVGNGGTGYSGDGGAATSSELHGPHGISFDRYGNLYIADSDNYSIRKVDLSETSFRFPSTSVGESSVPQNLILQLTADQSISSITSSASQGGNHEYVLGTISGCTIDGATVNASGTICTVPIIFSPVYPWQRNASLNVISNTGTYSLELSGIGMGPQIAFTPGTMGTVAGNGTLGYNGDGGPASSSELSNPGEIAFDSAGNLYIADVNNQRIRKVTASTGIISTVAGNGTPGFSGDGGPATSAELQNPWGVAVDNNGNLYIADTINRVIRKVSSSGTISTVAGVAGQWGYNADGIPATSAYLYNPQGVAVDSAGSIYIADTGNNRIRVVDPAGTITTFAGNGFCGNSGDGGPATSAKVCSPEGIAVDGSGNIYFTSGTDIRMVNPSGIISTVAGDGTGGSTGDGGPATNAELNDPVGVAVDSAGNLYIAELNGLRIREVNALTGIISTVAGDGTGGSTGDGGPATGAELNGPFGVAVDSTGNIFIADSFNYRIREVNVSEAPSLSFPATSVNTTSSPQTVSVGNIGNEALTFPTPTIGFNPSVAANFSYNPSSTCTQLDTASPESTLASDASCTMEFNFTPTAVGTINGGAAIRDDTLNASAPNYATQTIGLSGVGQETPIITWADPAAITFGTALSATQLNATASVPGTFSFSPTVGTAPNAGTQTLTTIFTPSDTVDYTTATAQVNLVVNKAVPSISAWPSAGAIAYGQTLASSTLTGGTASVGGTFAWSTPSTSPSAGAQPESVTFTPTDSVDYTAATAQVNLSVTRAPVTINVQSSENPSVYGNLLTYTFTFSGVGGMAIPTGQATVTSDGTNIGTVTLDATGKATFSLSTLSAGTHTIKAVYGGDPNYF